MLKWANQTRRRLQSGSELDDISQKSDGSRSDPEPLSPILYCDGFPKRKRTPVQRRRVSNQVKRPQSLFVSPDQISIDWNGSDDDHVNELERGSTTISLMTNSDTESLNSSSHRRLAAAASNLPEDVTWDEPDSRRGEGQDEVFAISTKPELLRITTDSAERNSPSFWKNLMTKKSWPGRSRKKVDKTSSLVETYRKIDDSVSSVSPIDIETASVSVGLGEMARCDLPKNTNISRRRSMKAIKKKNEHKKPKPFTKSVDLESRSSDRSPDSGYSDCRFSLRSVSIIDSSDDELTSDTPGSTDGNVFLRELPESLTALSIANTLRPSRRRSQS